MLSLVLWALSASTFPRHAPALLPVRYALASQPRLLRLRGGGRAHLHAALLLNRGGSIEEEESEQCQTDDSIVEETDEPIVEDLEDAKDESAGDDGVDLLADVIESPASALLRTVAQLYLALSKVLFQLGSVLPWDLLQAVCGLGMCFFGGSFAASIAAAEAFMMSGGAQAKGALVSLYIGAREVLAAHEVDEVKDEDGDGIADVKQLDAPALVLRKLRLGAAAVSEPDQLLAAVGGLYAGWLAVQATLRLKFAKVITLGVSIAHSCERPLLRLAAPLITPLVPDELRHWVPATLKTLIKAVAVALAWRLQIVSSAAQSSMRGGLLFARGVLAYANGRGWLGLRHEDSLLDEAVGLVVAAAGFGVQCLWRFDLPLVLDILLFPLTSLEWLLRWSIAK